MFTEAITDYDQVLKMNKWNPQVLFRRAFAYKALKNYSAAIADFASAKSMDPANARFNVHHR